MKRIVKNPEFRRSEIIESARKLFMIIGYEDTSVEKIIKANKIAKGTFYHYFKSKEDLLDALVLEMSDMIMDKLYECVDNIFFSAVEKLNKIFVLSRNIKAENMDLLLPLIRILYKSNNVLMRYKMFDSNMKLVVPLLVKTIMQGNSEGVFNVEYIEETANLIMVIGNSFSEKIAELLLADIAKEKKILKIERELKAYEQAISRMLGAENGIISIVDKNIVSIFVKE